MVLIALTLMAVGLVVSTLGYKLFKLLLPIVGLVSGTIIGFTGFQGLFGKGAVSTTVAVFVALTVGLVLALLSFVFFEIAVVVLTAILGASFFAYLGIALGLANDGFIVFLLSLAGFILGLVIASSGAMGLSFITILTSMIGVSFILAGVFLVAGSVSLDQLQNDGVVATILRVIDQSFLWTFVWIAGSLVANRIQVRTAMLEIMDNTYEFEALTAKK